MKKQKILKTLSAFICCITMLVMLSGCGKDEARTYTKEDPLVLRMGLVDGESTCYYKGAKEIADRVYEKTDGRIKINIGKLYNHIKQKMATHPEQPIFC